MAQTLSYRVDYAIVPAGSEVAAVETAVATSRQSTRVQIIEGYSTFADIAKIVAISRAAKPEDIVIMAVDLVGIRPDPQ